MVKEQPRSTGGKFASPGNGIAGPEESLGNDFDVIGGPRLVDPKAVEDGIESGSPGSDGDGSGEKRKAGWPKGKKRGASKAGGNPIPGQQTPLDLDGISKLLYSCHAILAGISKTPEIEFSEDESKKLGAAIVNVGRHYNLAVAEKTMDWTNLLMCAGMIYGSKLIAIKMRKASDRAARPEPEAEQPRNNAPGIDLTSYGINEAAAND